MMLGRRESRTTPFALSFSVIWSTGHSIRIEIWTARRGRGGRTRNERYVEAWAGDNGAGGTDLCSTLLRIPRSQLLPGEVIIAQGRCEIIQEQLQESCEKEALLSDPWHCGLRVNLQGSVEADRREHRRVGDLEGLCSGELDVLAVHFEAVLQSLSPPTLQPRELLRS